MESTAEGEAADDDLDEAVEALVKCPPGAANDGRARVVAAAAARMRDMAHRMLRRFPTVRRWNETDDVVQGAALRLHRALAATTPETTGRFLGLVALQIRRELLDLARSYTSPESFARNHETNVLRGAGGEVDKVALVADPEAEAPDAIAAWTRFHHAITTLPADDRELFDLVWFLGLPQERVATLLGCSTRTIRRRWEGVKQTLLQSMGTDVPT